MRKILIIGATSAIAEATARLCAARGDALFLIARDANRLEAIRADLTVRGPVCVGSRVMDVNAIDTHVGALAEASAALGGIDVVLVAHGTLPDQRACEVSVELTLQGFETNANSTIALLTRLAAQFDSQGHGTIAVIGSIAGDRGRQSNYVYGAAKAAVATFLSGMRQRLAKRGVTVLTIKPGFVNTPMTRAFRKNLLWVQPEAVASGILRAIEQRRAVVYVPGSWRVVMLVINSIPEFVFMRLKL